MTFTNKIIALKMGEFGNTFLLLYVFMYVCMYVCLCMDVRMLVF